MQIPSPVWCLFLALAIVAAFVVASHRRQLRGTTLVAPANWCLLSSLVLMVVETWLFLRPVGPAEAAWRYLAAVSTFCPMMALLGAKRPQDRGWQFIVASLWIVLALPATQDLVFSPGSRLHLHAAWQWFLIILIVISLANYLPTRFGGSAMLVAIGQWLLLREQSPFMSQLPTNSEPAWGLLLLALSILWARITIARRRDTRQGWSRVWIDFRDCFGVVWALRITERVNQSARAYGWPIRLTWNGFVGADQPADLPDQSAFSSEVELSLRTLLRRFVSPEWIDERVGP